MLRLGLRNAIFPMVSPLRRRGLDVPSSDRPDAGSPRRLPEVLGELQGEISRSRRYHRPFTVVVAEGWGSSHRSAPQATWSTLRDVLREMDIVAISEDSETLLLFCPETNRESAQHLLKRLRERFGHSAPHRFGLATFTDDGVSLQGMIEEAIKSARNGDGLDDGASATPPPQLTDRVSLIEVEAEKPANPATVRAPWIARFPLRERRPGRLYRAWKRFLDLFLLTVTAPAWVLVLTTCVGLIKLSSPRAPALFKQQRTGKDGRRFAMYKLRTMVPDAEEQKASLAELNELVWPDFKITNDPRVSRLGRFFRKTSLDEIAQVLNVIRGDMSLVGPRPTSFAADTYDVWHTERLDVSPGLTGLWQVAGRTSTLMDDRLRLDIAYLRRESVRLDLEILRRTVFSVLRQEGAS